MKKLTIPMIGISLLACAVTQATLAAELKTQQDKLSYSMGVMTGRAFKAHNIQVNANAFASGLSDALSGNKMQMADAQIQSTLEAFQKKSMEQLEAKMKEQAKENAKKGADFLAENKKKPGVVALPGGLQYKVLQEGKGASPTADDMVTVNYEGRLISGKVFDSSYERGKPATFAVRGVIKGWQDALTRMKPGALWEVYIPPQLAYGIQGAPGLIGPNETLIFKVNLISVQKKK